MKKLVALCALAAAVAVPATAGQVTLGQDLTNWKHSNTQVQESYGVPVSVEVTKQVAVWAGHKGVSLKLDGGSGNNEDYARATITVQNNTPCDLYAQLTASGSTAALPDGTNFMVTLEPTYAAGADPVTANPTGAGRAWWRPAGGTALGTAVKLGTISDSHTGTGFSPVVEYWADARDAMPAPPMNVTYMLNWIVVESGVTPVP